MITRTVGLLASTAYCKLLKKFKKKDVVEEAIGIDNES